MQDAGDLPSIVERPPGDRVGQHLLGIVAGEFDAAEQTGQGGGAVLDGERDALVGGEVTVVDELVEPAGGAAGGGELGGVGEQLGRVSAPTRPRSRCRRPERARTAEGRWSRTLRPARQLATGARLSRTVPGGASAGTARVTTWAVLACRPRVMPT